MSLSQFPVLGLYVWTSVSNSALPGLSDMGVPVQVVGEPRKHTGSEQRRDSLRGLRGRTSLTCEGLPQNWCEVPGSYVGPGAPNEAQPSTREVALELALVGDLLELVNHVLKGLIRSQLVEPVRRLDPLPGVGSFGHLLVPSRGLRRVLGEIRMVLPGVVPPGRLRLFFRLHRLREPECREILVDVD